MGKTETKSEVATEDAPYTPTLEDAFARIKSLETVVLNLSTEILRLTQYFNRMGI
jgi:hypothetical protein